MLDAERKLVCLPAGRDGTLAVSRSPTALRCSVKTHKSARPGALDPKSGNVYLTAGKLGPPVPPKPWPTVIPGSFEFFVVARKLGRFSGVERWGR